MAVGHGRCRGGVRTGRPRDRSEGGTLLCLGSLFPLAVLAAFSAACFACAAPAACSMILRVFSSALVSTSPPAVFWLDSGCELASTAMKKLGGYQRFRERLSCHQLWSGQPWSSPLTANR